MQEKRTPVFQNEDGSWGHITQTVNPLICTIEYSYNTGFPSKKEAEESYQKSLEAYSSQIQQLKILPDILFLLFYPYSLYNGHFNAKNPMIF